MNWCARRRNWCKRAHSGSKRWMILVVKLTTREELIAGAQQSTAAFAIDAGTVEQQERTHA